MSFIDLRFSVLTGMLLPLALLAAPLPSKDERHARFNEGWLFLKADAAGAEAPGFEDASWRRLTLPHDWAIEGPFDKQYNPSTGGLPVSGTGWYRKHFKIPASEKGRVVSVEFDGAMSNARVWLNGTEVAFRPYGYSSFAVDLTPQIRWDEANVLAVRLTPEPNASRWYPGAGIYRNVWLTITDPVHVAHWGTYVTTPEVRAERATVSILTEVENRNALGSTIRLETAIVDHSGAVVARTGAEASVPAGAKQNIAQRLDVASPRLWDIEHPHLYSAITEVKQGNRTLDRYVTSFGIRTIEFNKDKGFLLNGRYLKIQGVCNHHDLGALGTAVNVRALERQLEIMRSMGVNAIRTSHNPPAPELLDAADRMGFLVMDEAFDMWRIPKVKNGLSKFFGEWHERDLRDLVRRDRNHPSVFMWSIGNEIPEQGKADGGIMARQLTEICHKEDPTRPTTSAFNEPDAAIRNELAANVDVPGFNYVPTRYAEFQKAHPTWAIYGSETESCVSSRGVYHLPMKLESKTPDLQVSSYDIEAPPWAYCPDVEFTYQQQSRNVMGEFVWTGFDYLGEPTPYGSAKDWPSRSSYFGVVDLAGFPKDRFYIYKSYWTSVPTVHVFPHWNWRGREGQNIPVMVYTNAQEVELFLNGKSLGRKKLGVDTFTMPVNEKVSKTGFVTSRFRLVWNVPYTPGELRAVGYRDGKEYAVDSVRTAGSPARIVLSPDRKSIRSGGEDLSFVTVRIEDNDGNLCPLADNLVRFKVAGPGSIAGVDNGNAATVEPFKADYRKAFNGMALLIVRSATGKAGDVRVTATSGGLLPADVSIEVVEP